MIFDNRHVQITAIYQKSKSTCCRWLLHAFTKFDTVWSMCLWEKVV